MTPILLMLLFPSQMPSDEQRTSQLRACPVPTDPAPFLRSPRLELLGACNDATNCASPADTSSNWTHTFHRAARFTIPRFGQHQQPLEGDGLLIYEGMTLTVNPTTGVYDLNFTATAPPMPVTIRMQLQFSKKNHPFTTTDPIRLTLPPIEIDSDPNTRPGDNSGSTLRVNHRGYTELFKNPAAQKESTDLKESPRYRELVRFQIDSGWTIIRAGSARFGSGSANSDSASTR